MPCWLCSPGYRQCHPASIRESSHQECGDQWADAHQQSHSRTGGESHLIVLRTIHHAFCSQCPWRRRQAAMALGISRSWCYHLAFSPLVDSLSHRARVYGEVRSNSRSDFRIIERPHYPIALFRHFLRRCHRCRNQFRLIKNHDTTIWLEDRRSWCRSTGLFHLSYHRGFPRSFPDNQGCGD